MEICKLLLDIEDEKFNHQQKKESKKHHNNNGGK